MNITLDRGQLRCDFRFDQRIIDRLHSVPGAEYDKHNKAWFVPVAQADKLMAAMPLASFDYAAIGAACDAEQQRGAVFAACLAAWDIALRVDADGALVAEGASVSPLIQELVTARAADLRRYVGGVAPKAALMQPAAVQVAPTTGERAIANGIRNAAKREQEQAARGRGRRPRRKVKLVQQELFHAT